MQEYKLAVINIIKPQAVILRSESQTNHSLLMQSRKYSEPQNYFSVFEGQLNDIQNRAPIGDSSFFCGESFLDVGVLNLY